MSEMNLPYSEHIYDPERLELARTILEKEARKLLLDLDDDAWQKIDKSIQGWSDSPTDYHLESAGPRDFWDSFAAFMEGIKLKTNFTAWLTAENVSWTRMNLSVRKIQMTSPLGQLEKVPSLNLRKELPFAELIDVFTASPEVVPEQKRLIDQHSTDPVQDTYPIIVREAEDGLFKVMDGNRRTLKAVIYGQDTMDAWVGRTNGNKPANFWVPINDMFQLLKVFKDAVEFNDDVLQTSVARVLKSRFNASEVAEQAYRNRVGNQTDIGKKLLEIAQQQP